MRLIHTVSITLLLLCAVPAPATAQYSGAQFLSGDRSFAEGYAHGVLESRLSIYQSDADDRARQSRERACFLGTGMNSSDFARAVERYIEANPPALAEGALGAVVRTILAICPTP